MAEEELTFNINDYPELLKSKSASKGLTFNISDYNIPGMAQPEAAPTDFNTEFTKRMAFPLPPQRGGSLRQLLENLPTKLSNPDATVSMIDRAKVKNLVIDPVEQVDALRKLGYKNAEVRNGEVYVDNQLLDPSKTGSLQEMLSEVFENPALAVEGTLGNTPMTGGLVSGGLATAREFGKKAVFGIDPNLSTIALETGMGTAAGGLAKYTKGGLNKGEELVSTGLTKVEKALDPETKLIEQAKQKARDAADYAKGIIPDSVKKTTKKILDGIVGKEAVAREMGARSEDIMRFGAKPITENLDYVIANSPEFKTQVMQSLHPKDKINNAIALHDKLGGEVRAFYQQNPNIPVSGSDIIVSEGYKKIAQSSLDTTIEPGIRAQITDERIGFLTHLVQSDMPAKKADEFVALIKREFSDDDPLEVAEMLEKMVAKKKFNLDSIWEVRKNRDAYGAYGKQIAERSQQSLAVARNSADAVRESIYKGVENSGVENAEQLAKNAKLFSELTPIVEMIDRGLAKDVGVWNGTKFLWSKISSRGRQVLEQTTKLVTNPATRSSMRRLANMINPNDLLPNTEKIGLPELAGSILKDTIKGGVKVAGMSRLPLAVQAGQRLATDEVSNYKPEDLQRIAPIAPVILPRDPELIASNPQALEELTASLSPDAARLFKHAIASKDPMKLRLATLSAMSEVPDLFEPSVTGNQSEIRVGEGFVLADPMEAQVYKKSLRAKYSMGLITRTFLAKQLSSLNNLNDMRLFPPAEGFPKNKEQEHDTKVSPLLGVRKRAVRTLVGERNAQNY